MGDSQTHRQHGDIISLLLFLGHKRVSSILFHCVVNNDNILIMYRRRFISIICVCYSWEIALNVFLSVSFVKCRTAKKYGRKHMTVIVSKLL
jgi:hypothetical protein